MLTIPSNAKTIELITSTIWFDEEGILWSKSKKAPAQSLQESKDAIAIIKNHLGGEKVCMILDITEAVESSREVRDFAAQELSDITKAMALISNSALGGMIANLFFLLSQGI